jgi:thiamine phosphate synthase YjbQ (UPF0047 family)
MIHQEEMRIRSRGHGDLQDITAEVDAVVGESGVTTGTAHVFNVGSTGVIGTIEFEPGLQEDLPEILNRLIPRAGTTATSGPGTTATATVTSRRASSGRT